MSLKIHTFGTLQVYQEDELVTDFVSSKAVVLLVYLALHPYHHARETLADLFWQDTRAAQAMTNLRNALSSINRLLPDYIEIDRNHIAINTAAEIWIDSQTLDQAISSFKVYSQSRPKPSRKMIESLQQAMTLYHGEFLVGVNLKNCIDLENWITAQQRYFANLYIEALKVIAEFHLNNRNYDVSLSFLAKIEGLNPWWEEAQQLYIKALALSGRRTEALQQFETCRQNLLDEFDIEPTEETIQLYERVKQNALTEQPQQTFHMPPKGECFGRERCLEQILERLDNPHCRLLTLTGLSGIGKTQLAYCVAEDCVHDFVDGIYFVEMNTQPDAPSLSNQILHALQISIDSSHPDMLLTALENQHLLLILDQFVSRADDLKLINHLLNRAPHVQVLITSHAPLNIENEWVYQVNGLDTPSLFTPQSEFMDYAAIQLFLSVSGKSNYGVDIEAYLWDIVRICQLVDGMPLAIMIAAKQLHLFKPNQLYQFIKTDITFLKSIISNADDRHHAIVTILDTTWERLCEDERETLMKLSTFEAQFSLADLQFLAAPPIDIITQLVNKGLLHTQEDDHFAMPHLVRQYAYQHLRDSPIYDTVMLRYAERFLGILQELYETASAGLSFEQLDKIYDNACKALEYIGDQNLVIFWSAIFQHQAWYARQFFGRVFEPNLIHLTNTNDQTLEENAAYFFCRAEFYWVMGDTTRAHESIATCLDYAQQGGWTQIEIDARCLWVEIEAFSGNYDEAIKILESILNHDIPQYTIQHLVFCLGVAAMGIVRASSEFFTPQFYALMFATSYCVDLYRLLLKMGFEFLDHDRLPVHLSQDILHLKSVEKSLYAPEVFIFFNTFAQMGLLFREWYWVENILAEALQIGEKIDNQFQMLFAILGVASRATLQQEYEQATRLYGFLQRFHLSSFDNTHQQIQNHMAYLRDTLGDATFEELFAKGQSMTLQSAIDLAMPQKPHALLIDDDVNDLRILEKMIELEDMTCTKANTPQEALAKVDAFHNISIIFIDLKMPQSDGYWLFDRLKSHPKLQGIPIVAYTGNTHEAKRAYDMGFHSMISKPIDMMTFSQIVKQILDGERIW